jgi:8-oxo-dGTP pyrophosphatase MutT (NUDIX family)
MHNKLIDDLTHRLQRALPSALAHEPMRAIPVGTDVPNFQHKLPPKPGSVLILLYVQDNQIKFPLIKRPEYIGAHSGQVSLPGGKAEAGEDAIQTALREGEEEIGIDQKTVKVLGRLSDFFVIPSNFMVTPVVATVDYVPQFVPDAFEVSKIIYGSVEELVKDEAILIKEIVAAGKFRMTAPHFEIENEVVWGATAMILNELRYVLREVLGK